MVYKVIYISSSREFPKTMMTDPKINGVLKVISQAFKDGKRHLHNLEGGSLNVRLARLFALDVVSKTVVAGRDDLLELMYTSIIRAGAVGGQMHLALNEKDEVIGTACWFPPGADFLAEYVNLIELLA